MIQALPRHTTRFLGLWSDPKGCDGRSSLVDRSGVRGAAFTTGASEMVRSNEGGRGRGLSSDVFPGCTLDALPGGESANLEASMLRDIMVSSFDAAQRVWKSVGLTVSVLFFGRCRLVSWPCCVLWVRTMALDWTKVRSVGVFSPSRLSLLSCL